MLDFRVNSISLVVVKVVIVSGESFLVGLVVLSKLLEKLIQGGFIEISLLNKIISHRLLLAALMKEEGANLQWGE